MQTVTTDSPKKAAEFIKRGGIVAFPTETVYGLGANIFDPAAIAKVFKAKRRPADNPLIAHVSDVQQIGELAAEITDSARKFIDAFFPGPLTVVLQRSSKVPLIASAGLDTIGIRMPRYETARGFLSASGVPVAAPSANLSGRPSPTTWQAVAEDLDGRIDCILQGDASEIGIESTVVDCTSDVPVILRSGSISLEQLRAVVEETRAVDLYVNHVTRSPGMRHPHYSPHARVIVVKSGHVEQTASAAYIGLNPPHIRFEHGYVCRNVEEYAHSLFEFFRECDRRGIEKIYCESVAETGIGAALMDRLRRAAAA